MAKKVIAPKRHAARRMLDVLVAARGRFFMPEVEFHGVWVRLASGDPARIMEPRWSVFEEPLRVAVFIERNGERVLPIWMGSADAFSLLRHQRGMRDGRPIAATVMADLLMVTGARVSHVRITDFRENVLYSAIDVRADGSSEEVDARPSDALNLAVRVGAPIVVSEEVMSDAALSVGQLPERLEELQQKTFETPLEGGQWRPLSSDLISELKQAAA